MLDVRRLRRMTMSTDKMLGLTVKMFGLMVNSLGLTVKMLILKRKKKRAGSGLWCDAVLQVVMVVVF